jgi:hypothetical protein
LCDFGTWTHSTLYISRLDDIEEMGQGSLKALAIRHGSAFKADPGWTALAL